MVLHVVVSLKGGQTILKYGVLQSSAVDPLNSPDSTVDKIPLILLGRQKLCSVWKPLVCCMTIRGFEC